MKQIAQIRCLFRQPITGVEQGQLERELVVLGRGLVSAKRNDDPELLLSLVDELEMQLGEER